MNKNNECSYGNIMRFCKHITTRELNRGVDFDFIQDTLVKAVEMGCAKGLAKFLNETDIKEYEECIWVKKKRYLQNKSELNSSFGKVMEDLIYAPKRENNRNKEHTYKKD